MAKGYPDYFGQSIWPKYGTMLYDTYDDTVPPGGSDTLIDLIIQGQVAWGSIRLWSATELFVQLWLTVDDMIDLYMDDDYFLLTNIPGTMGYPYLCTYNDSGKAWLNLAQSFPIPFHTNYKMRIKNLGANDIVVFANWGYYDIT